MFVALALPASTSFVSSVPCVDRSYPMHAHSFQAGWITATLCSQASQTLSFGSYCQCCVSLQDSEVRSDLRNHPRQASLAVRQRIDSSWEFWSASACTMHNGAPLNLMEMALYPCHTFPGYVCFVHLLTEILLCRGQIVFGWVLEVSRVLGPHSETVFQLTWKLQIKLSMYMKNCLKHFCLKSLQH